MLLQNDGSNFLSWSIHLLNAFRAISPLVERIVDASIPLLVVDWSNYKNIPKEEERCVQLNAQAINIILSTLSAEVLDEAIFNGQTPLESAHLIWTRLVDLYGNPNVMMYTSSRQWKICPLCRSTVKRPHKT